MSAHEGLTDAELLAATPADPEAFATFYRRHVSAHATVSRRFQHNGGERQRRLSRGSSRG